MTKKDALNTAIATLSQSNENDEAVEILRKMVEQLSKPRVTSDEAKAKRKDKTAAARAELLADVLPVLRASLRSTLQGMTAKEVYDCAKAELPEDFTANKVQYILLHELADEVIKTETKGKPNTYRIENENV